MVRTLADPVLALRIILYKLYYLRDVYAEEALGEDFIALVQRDYSSAEIARMAKALEWADTHPDYDFSSLLPGLPQSNDEIRHYLRTVHDRFRQGGLAPPAESTVDEAPSSAD